MGVEEMPDRERRVIERVAGRLAVARNVNRLYDEELTFGDRVADRVAAFGGSWTFIVCFALVLAARVGFNSFALMARPFDPYPYIFLNLILSMLAAIQAPVIMMSQNRQTLKDRLAAAHDYEVNLKAEIEILALHEKIESRRGSGKTGPGSPAPAASGAGSSVQEAASASSSSRPSASASSVSSSSSPPAPGSSVPPARPSRPSMRRCRFPPASSISRATCRR
ncbi:MAG: DUF1003 domain-containing protein [Geminicoccaceae bacterium]|nr:DUF1003 domain-containing protein [Geminicoccaceae bacterium]